MDPRKCQRDEAGCEKVRKRERIASSFPVGEGGIKEESMQDDECVCRGRMAMRMVVCEEKSRKS